MDRSRGNIWADPIGVNYKGKRKKFVCESSGKLSKTSASEPEVRLLLLISQRMVGVLRRRWLERGQAEVV